MPSAASGSASLSMRCGGSASLQLCLATPFHVLCAPEGDSDAAADPFAAVGVCRPAAVRHADAGRRESHHHPRWLRLDVGADRRQGPDRDRPRDAEPGAGGCPRRARARLHELRASREGFVRRHRTLGAAGRRNRRGDQPGSRGDHAEGQDADLGCGAARGRGPQIHRGQGDGDPDHRRARDLRGRSLRAGELARNSGRRLHYPCGRLRAHRRRGQAGGLPRREYRRQVYRRGRRGDADRGAEEHGG